MTPGPCLLYLPPSFYRLCDVHMSKPLPKSIQLNLNTWLVGDLAVYKVGK